jgi:acyl-coenzyme A thioesterase PaaI-like protein
MTDLVEPSEFMELLEIQFDEVRPTRVSGSVAADERHHQSWGLVHGGLYTTAIETFASTGAYEAVKDRGQQAVGVNNVTDLICKLSRWERHRWVLLDVSRASRSVTYVISRQGATA